MPARRSRLLALAGIVGTLAATGAAGQSAASGDASERDSGWLALLRDVRFAPGPIRWNGELTTELRMQAYSSQPSIRTFVESGNLAMATYIHQPWFAQASANLGFTYTLARAQDPGQSFSLTGGGTFTLFPTSRFPFEASLSVADSRASEDALGADYRNTLLTLRQQYRARDDTLYTVRLDHSDLSGASFGHDTLDVVSASLNGRRTDHAYAADAFVSESDGGSSGIARGIRRVNATHGYTPADNLTIDSLFTYDEQDVRHRQGLLSGGISGRYVQLNSYATWRPDEESRFYDPNHALLATAGVRITSAGLEVGGAAADAIGVNLSGGASYDVGPFTRLVANGSVAHASTGGGADEVFTSFNAQATYDPSPIPVLGSVYSWRASGGLSSATGGAQTRQGAGALFSHQITRDISLRERSVLTLTLGQSAGVNVNTLHQDGYSLSFNAQATWTIQEPSAAQTYASLGYSDVRSIGTPENSLQLVNLQLTRQAPVDALSYWSANLTVQGARQRAEPSALGDIHIDTGFHVSTSGTVAYSHRRVFGVPRLRFTASYTANQVQATRSEGDVRATPQLVGDTLDARLEYRIGKLDMRLVVRSAAVEDKRTTGIYLRATRYF